MGKGVLRSARKGIPDHSTKDGRFCRSRVNVCTGCGKQLTNITKKRKLNNNLWKKHRCEA